MLRVILIVIVAIVLWRLYHKMFNITYFGFTPMIKEIVTCFLLAMLIIGLLIPH